LLKLFLAHVFGIEVRAEWLGADALHERLVSVEAVPWAVVQFREPPRIRIRDRLQPGLVIITVGLAPIEIVHDLCGVDQQADHFFLIVT